MGFFERLLLKKDYHRAFDIVAPGDGEDVVVSKENTRIICRAVKYMLSGGMSAEFMAEYETMYVSLYYPYAALLERLDKALEDNNSDEVPQKVFSEPPTTPLTISEHLIYDIYERYEVDEYLETLVAKIEVLLVLLSQREAEEAKSASWRTDYRWTQLYYVLCDFFTLTEVLLKISR